MSVAFTSIKGLTFYDTQRAFNGFTLITPVEGSGVWLIDMYGRVVHQWRLGRRPAWQAELLPNGHLLCHVRVEDNPLGLLEGAGGALLELDWNGNKVWERKDPYLHHGFFRMENGNTLVIKWTKVPEEIARKVKTEGTDSISLGWGVRRKGPMWGDAIQEITPEGKVVWEWIGHEHLDPEADVTCPVCPPNEWTHATSVAEMPDGSVMASFMESNLVVIIDKGSGDIKWRFGRRVLEHQHFATVLDNGNLLVFDNDLHSFAPRSDSRVLELDPTVVNPTLERMYFRFGAQSNAIVWVYPPDERRILGRFFSSTLASCQRLPNGNTLICEGTWGRVFEVNPRGEHIWEFVNYLPSYETSPTKSQPCMLYSAFRYGVEYSGLERDNPLPVKRQAAPGTLAMKKVADISARRLTALGY